MDPIASLLRDNWNALEDINQRAGHQPVLDALMVFSANDLIFLLPLLLRRRGAGERTSLLLPERTLGQQMILLACGAVALALAFNLALGSLIYEPRPFVSHPGIVHLLISRAADASFPSDHSAVASAIASMLVLYVPLAACAWLRHLKRVAPHCGGWPAAPGGGGAGGPGSDRRGAHNWPRADLCGVHYPADIVGGAACGLLAALLLTALRPWIHPLLDRGIHLIERVHLA